MIKGLHDLACGERELCSLLGFPVLSATPSILICVVLWTQAKRVIPSSITVSVTLVLMAGPVRIGWMDITVIVHLVSNCRKLFRLLASAGKLKSKMDISDVQSSYRKESYTIIYPWLFKHMWTLSFHFVSSFFMLCIDVVINKPPMWAKRISL